MDKIDPLYYVRSSRIDLKEETRIKATSEEVQAWEESVKDSNGKFTVFPKYLSLTGRCMISSDAEFHFQYFLPHHRHESLWVSEDYPDV
jgi:hypothetical protein